MKVLKRENLYSGFLGLDQVLIELDNGEKIVREIINKKDTVGIIAMNDNDEIYFTIQPRAGIDKSNSIELPGGLINEHELPIEAAKRELLEETGCVCDSIELFQKYVADPACCNSVSYIFLAKGAKKISELKLDSDEFLETCLLPIKKVFDMIDEGEICDASSLISLLKLKNIYNF